MSSTALAAAVPRRAAHPLPSPALAAGLAFLVLASGVLAIVLLDGPMHLLARGAQAASTLTAACPGARGDLLLAGGLDSASALGPLAALMTVSLFALPALFVAGACSAPPGAPRIAQGALAAGHPASVALAFAGFGWAALSLYGASRLLALSPTLRPEKGVPLAGLALAACLFFLPLHPALLGLVLGAMTAAAHRSVRGRHKRAFVVLAALPTVLLHGALAYSGWLYGAEAPVLPPRGEGLLLTIGAGGLLLAGLAPRHRGLLALSLGGSALAFFLADPFMG